MASQRYLLQPDIAFPSAEPRARVGALLLPLALAACPSEEPATSDPGAGGTASTGSSSTGTTASTALEPTSTQGTSTTLEPTSTTGASTTLASTSTTGALATSTTSSSGDPDTGAGTTMMDDPSICHLGDHRCSGPVLQACNGDGTWIDVQTCDPYMGLSCNPNGFCAGPCGSLEPSYRGCDYYIVSTSQVYTVFLAAEFGVSVSTGDHEATIRIEATSDGSVVDQRIIPANSSATIPLPHVSALTSALQTTLVPGGAYRLRATAPVTVAQYNPIQNIHSNEASLLLPTHTWTGHYRVVSHENWLNNWQGMFAVVAREDGTTVTIVPPNENPFTAPGAGIDELGQGVVMLDAGDVLQVLTTWVWDGDVQVTGDLTGAQVLADKPVQVIAGHECTAMPPQGDLSCDHLEDSMLPFETLGRQYVVVPPVQWPDPALTKAVFVRIVAAEDGATLTFEPDQAVPKFLSKQGDFIEIGPTTEPFVVTSDRKLVVAEFMVGSQVGYGNSEPAMTLAVPREQFRGDYLFHALSTWADSFITVVAPLGTIIDVDGGSVPALTPIGASGLGFAQVELSNAGDGTHRAIGDEPFGIHVYGLGGAGSYWYPGGLDLAVIPPQ